MNITASKLSFGNTVQPGANLDSEKVEQSEKNKSPENWRMAARYGVALPVAYQVVEFGIGVAKGQGLWDSLKRGSLKVLGALVAVGAVAGLGMKQLTDKYPDNKIIKATNTVAKWFGIGV